MKFFISWLEELHDNMVSSDPASMNNYESKFMKNYLPEHSKEIPSSIYTYLQTCPGKKFVVSTDNNGNKVIPFLEDMKKHTSDNVYAYVPSLYINGNLVRGIDAGDIAASAVCDSFKVTPKSCSSLSVSLKGINDMNVAGHAGGIVIIVLICLALFVITFYLYKKVMVGQVDKDVTEMVNYHLERYQQIQTAGSDNL